MKLFKQILSRLAGIAFGLGLVWLSASGLSWLNDLFIYRNDHLMQGGKFVGFLMGVVGIVFGILIAGFSLFYTEEKPKLSEEEQAAQDAIAEMVKTQKHS